MFENEKITIREQMELREDEFLSKYAMRSRNSAGRERQ